MLSMRPLELDPSELEKIAAIYDKVRAAYRKVKPSVDKVLARDFDESLRKVMMDLSGIFKDQKVRRIQKEVHIEMSKFHLIEMC